MISDNRIIILKGDISLVDADAVVNAANTSLLGGGGVDGAIHTAAGPGLLEECRELNGCEVGDVKVTTGHNLKARFVFHAVGPIWRGGGNDEHMLLASCYRRAMEKASELKLETIAFPAISTGAYRFPPEEAAMVALTEIRRFLKRNSHPATVYLVAFTDEQYSLYMKTLRR